MDKTELTEDQIAWLKMRIRQLSSRRNNSGPYRAAGCQRTIDGMRKQLRTGQWKPPHPEGPTMTELHDTLMIELAYCRHVELSVSETAHRIEAMMTRKHVFWGAGEPDCPKEIKAGNGELHTLRCKVCGQDSMHTSYCLGGDRP